MKIAFSVQRTAFSKEISNIRFQRRIGRIGPVGRFGRIRTPQSREAGLRDALRKVVGLTTGFLPSQE